MRRAHRLFDLLQRLAARRRGATAAQLAQELGVSLRTVYRDVAALQAQGVPVEGEAGVGYRLRPGYLLPALMFTPAQAEALVAAVRLAEPRMDAQLRAQARQALAKLLGALPGATRVAAEALPLYAPARPIDAAVAERLGQLRRAIEAQHRLDLQYLDAQGRASLRRVRPLACLDWGEHWTLAAWCELRQDFRSFRLDRVQTLHDTGSVFVSAPGDRLLDLLRRVCYAPGDAAGPVGPDA